jgi:hypothetical protein
MLGRQSSKRHVEAVAFQSEGIFRIPQPEEDGGTHGQTKTVQNVLFSYTEAHKVQ